MRVFPPRDAGSCAKRSPWICPEFGRTGGPSDQSCQWSFVCDNGEFKVDCTMAGPTYTCTCIENDSKQVGQFSLADACATADALEKEANAACGWELWKPPLVPLPPAP